MSGIEGSLYEARKSRPAREPMRMAESALRGRLSSTLRNLFVVGVDWRAGGRYVEQARRYSEAIAERVEELVSGGVLQEALVISTCNRFEVVGVRAVGIEEGSQKSTPVQTPEDLLAAELTVENAKQSIVGRWQGTEALRHIFRLAAGLESALLGERDIRGQLRASLRCALDSAWCSSALEQVVHEALDAARLAHEKTAVGAGHSSLAEVAAIEALGQGEGDTGTDGERRILLVGAGEMIDKCARRLMREPVTLLFANRTRQKADELASRYGGQAVAWPSQGGPRVSIVVTATSSARVLLGARQLRAMLTISPGISNPLVVDLGMPPDVDAKAAEALGARYVGLSDLALITEETRVERERAAEMAGIVVDERLAAFCQRARRMQADPWVSALQRRYRETVMAALGDLEATLGRGQGPRSPDDGQLDGASAERQNLEKWAHRLARRLAHDPSRALRVLAEADLLDAFGAAFDGQDRRHVS